MHKGSLIDILFEKSISEEPGRSVVRPQSSKKEKKKNCYDFSGGHSRPQAKHSNKVIKITQFNSSLIIGEDKRMHSNPPKSNSQSPQKHFNIKKITQFKNKIMVNAQKAAQKQFKRKDQDFIISLKPSSAENSFSHKQSISKSLVATKWNVNKELPSLDHLLSSFNLDDHLASKEYDSIKGIHLNSISLNQAMSPNQLQTSNDKLSSSTESLKKTFQKEENELANIDFCCKIDELRVTSPRRISSPRKMNSRIMMEQKKYQQNLEKEKKEILERKKELNKNYSKPFNPPENISAQNYVIYETDLKKVTYNLKIGTKKEEQQPLEVKKMLIHSHKIIASVNPRNAVEIASLTKIMTCIVTLETANRLGLDISKESVTIGFFEQNIGGTSANIKKGQIYTINQLLFGLMLPSGNDASLALAVWAGNKLLQSQKNQSDHFMKRQSYNRFINQMNNKANELMMQKTRYSNSHGLSHIENKSCAFDLGILCEYAMNNKTFREIVSTKVYQSKIRLQNEEKVENERSSKVNLTKKSSIEDPQGLMELEQMKDAQESMQEYPEVEEEIEEEHKQFRFTKPIKWQNSHLLLQNKPHLYVGIKTGVTTTAGPCLASCIQIKGRRFIIIVLNCKTMKFRFKDTQNLRKWLFQREGLKYKDIEGEVQTKH